MAIKEPKKQFDFVVHRNGYKIRRERCRPFRAAYESRKEQKLKKYLTEQSN